MKDEAPTSPFWSRWTDALSAAKAQREMPSKRQAWAGYAVLCITSVFFSLQALFTKLASDNGVPALQTFAFRGWIQAIYLGVPLLYQDKPFFGTGITQKWVIVRGFTNVLASAPYYWAVTQMDLGDAITIMSTYAVFACIVGYFWMGERLIPVHYVALIASISGTVFLSHPQFIFGEAGEGPVRGNSFTYGMAIVGAIFSGLSVASVRKAKEADTMQIIFSCSLCSSLAALFFWNVVQDFVIPPTPMAWAYTLMAVHASLIGQIGMTVGYSLAPTGPASVIMSSDIVFAYIYDVLIYDTYPTTLTWVGVILIVFSIVLVAFAESRQSSQATPSRHDYEPIGRLSSESGKFEFEPELKEHEQRNGLRWFCTTPWLAEGFC